MLKESAGNHGGGKGGSRRVVLSALGAAAVSLPFAWLLSFLAFHFLGLFFFTLAGLIFGALAYRWSKPAAPLSRKTVWAVSAFIVLTCWLTSIIVEAHAIPSLIADRQMRIRRLPEGMTRDTYFESQRQFARERLDAEAWPGGVAGYIRWVVTDGVLDLQGGVGPVKSYPAPQKSWVWVARAVFSLILLGFGVHSQVKGLVAKASSKDEGISPEQDSESEPGTIESAAHAVG